MGAVAGQAVEKNLTRRPGLEMTIKLDSGDTVVVAQHTPPHLGVGDRVRVEMSMYDPTRGRRRVILHSRI